MSSGTRTKKWTGVILVATDRRRFKENNRPEPMIQQESSIPEIKYKKGTESCPLLGNFLAFVCPDRVLFFFLTLLLKTIEMKYFITELLRGESPRTINFI